MKQMAIFPMLTVTTAAIKDARTQPRYSFSSCFIGTGSVSVSIARRYIETAISLNNVILCVVLSMKGLAYICRH